MAAVAGGILKYVSVGRGVGIASQSVSEIIMLLFAVCSKCMTLREVAVGVVWPCVAF